MSCLTHSLSVTDRDGCRPATDHDGGGASDGAISASGVSLDVISVGDVSADGASAGGALACGASTGAVAAGGTYSTGVPGAPR